MKRGFVRKSARHPETKQRAMLESMGVKIIYSDDAEGLDVYINSLRHGNEAWVTTLGRLAPSREALRAAMKKLHDAGAVIVEAKTGRRSDDAKQMACMVFDAANELAGDKRRLSHGDAVAFGRRGGRRRYSAALPDGDALMIWRNKDISTGEAAEKIGLGVTSCYRRFGKRETPTGRPRLPPTPFTDNDKGKVYFIRAGKTDRVKIGWTVQWRARLKELETGNHEKLTLLAMVDAEHRTDEKDMHKRFAKYHIRGEWFKLAGELEAFISLLTKPPSNARKRSK